MQPKIAQCLEEKRYRSRRQKGALLLVLLLLLLRSSSSTSDALAERHLATRFIQSSLGLSLVLVS